MTLFYQSHILSYVGINPRYSHNTWSASLAVVELQLLAFILLKVVIPKQLENHPDGLHAEMPLCC